MLRESDFFLFQDDKDPKRGDTSAVLKLFCFLMFALLVCVDIKQQQQINHKRFTFLAVRLPSSL